MHRAARNAGVYPVRVFVTGSSSQLARALLPELCALREVEHVTGIDLAPRHCSHPKFSARRADIRDPRLEQWLQGHDALVHLAWVVLRGRMRPESMFEINVTGGLRAFRAARAAGVRRLIHLSSAAVYGEGIDLAEDAPFRPLAGFLYAEHKALLENALAGEFPDCVRLRPHVILGPHAQPLLKWLMRQPFYPRLPQPLPRLQCVHEDDVASAILSCLQRDARGPYNLAAAEHVSYRALIERRHKVALPLPLAAARAGSKLAWKFWGWGGEPAWIEGLTRTLLLDCRRARNELGWRPHYDLAAMLKTG